MKTTQTLKKWATMDKKEGFQKLVIKKGKIENMKAKVKAPPPTPTEKNSQNTI